MARRITTASMAKADPGRADSARQSVAAAVTVGTRHPHVGARSHTGASWNRSLIQPRHRAAGLDRPRRAGVLSGPLPLPARPTEVALWDRPGIALQTRLGRPACSARPFPFAYPSSACLYVRGAIFDHTPSIPSQATSWSTDMMFGGFRNCSVMKTSRRPWSTPMF